MVDALSLFSINNLLTTSLFTKKSIIPKKNNDRFSEFSVLFRAEVNEKRKIKIPIMRTNLVFVQLNTFI
jgi:hypothetical protein